MNSKMLSNVGAFLCSLPNDTKAASLGSAVIKAEMSIKLGVFPVGMRRVQNGLCSRMVSEDSHFLAIEITMEMTHGPHDSECF